MDLQHKIGAQFIQFCDKYKIDHTAYHLQYTKAPKRGRLHIIDTNAKHVYEYIVPDWSEEAVEETLGNWFLQRHESILYDILAKNYGIT